MSFKHKGIGLALLGAMLALASCRELSLEPVFYALSRETPLGDNRGFPDGATAHRMVKIGTRYFAAANRLYARTDGISDTWSVVAPPADAILCNYIEAFSGELYAGFATGAGAGLYRSAPDPISWTKIADLGTAAGYTQVTMLKATAAGTPTLFVATWNGSDYALSYSTSGASGSYTLAGGTAWPAPVSVPIIDVESDGSYYWVIVGNSLLRDTAAAGVGSFDTTLLDKDSPVPLKSGAQFYGGLLYDSSVPRLYLSAGNGYLHSSDDSGDTWDSSALQRDTEDNDAIVHFTSFVLPASDASAVYVGTQGQGYYRIPGGDVTGDLTRNTDYTIAALYSGALNCLFYDGLALPYPRLFLCTNADGLWRGEWVSGSTWTWRQE
jgi:hypothetical protein